MTLKKEMESGQEMEISLTWEQIERAVDSALEMHCDVYGENGGGTRALTIPMMRQIQDDLGFDREAI